MGLARFHSGCEQGDQPECGEVGFGPALIVASARAACAFVPLAQNGSHSLPYPGVQGLECSPMAVFEILKPAPQRPVDVGGDFAHRAASDPAGFLPDGCSQLVQALLARPPIAALEVVTQKVEASLLAGVHDARFGW